MRIKERDKSKVAFTTLEELFEPAVMFFGLTNLLATLYTIMNELLRDLINIGKEFYWQYNSRDKKWERIW